MKLLLGRKLKGGLRNCGWTIRFSTDSFGVSCIEPCFFSNGQNKLENISESGKEGYAKHFFYGLVDQSDWICMKRLLWMREQHGLF